MEIQEIWSCRLNPSDLYNIERSLNDNPDSGGGHTYIQVSTGLVEPLLKFLDATYPSNGTPIILNVGNQRNPNSSSETLEFYSKSSQRMRISKQNRHRHSRLSAWLPQVGFPSLKPNETTQDARALLSRLGGVHIYLARGPDNSVWAGYTKGTPTARESCLPFADIMWGNKAGGYWCYDNKDEA